jgi:5-methylcytosine-specific restriction protein A
MSTPFQAVAPTAEQYLSALRRIGEVPDTLVQMLRLHFHTQNKTTTAGELAAAVGYTHRSVANSLYGRLGGRIGKLLNFDPGSVRVDAIVLTTKPKGCWLWTLRPEFAAALEMIGWVDSSHILLPEEISATAELKEGSVLNVTVNLYERNAYARRVCIDHYGYDCCICGFNFGQTFGKMGEGFIHVHHLKPLAEIGKEYLVDPVEDLRPVCPNCHAMLHRRVPAFTLSEIQRILNPIAKQTKD